MTRIPARLGRRGACLALLLAGVAGSGRAAGDAALTVADLAAYRAALLDSQRVSEPAAMVGFRELWNHPAAYQGRRVQVQGRLVRRFRQGSFGTYPPLEEAWVFSPAGDPYCLVFPAPSAPAAARPITPGAAQPVRFAGTFLKLVEYQAGDGPRLAPLIVGPAGPVAVTTVAASRRSVPMPGTRTAGWSRTRLDGMIAVAAAVVVGLVLAHQHLRRPMRHPLDQKDALAPDPLFEDALGPRHP